MGSGVSASFGDDGNDLLAATFLIGQAIAAITFPGMFRIFDFHSSLAPRIKQAQNAFAFFGMDEDSEEEGDHQIDPSQYEHLFRVTVGNDTIYLEDPTGTNECNWTPLHTCCMSFVTVPAGLTLIEEHKRLGVTLDTATMAGPGTFNSQWTALHMACAYGVEPLVERLIAAGANVNTQNSFGYTPILEACHRGYLNVVGMLLSSGKIDLAHIPDESLAANSPFISSPPQSPLAEAARSGFQKITQLILDHGAPKDLQNKLGWSALHEACFFNRVETVKTLLLAGCRGDLRTRSGALPYHLASLQIVREMLGDMGGPGAVPSSQEDTIDMVLVLRELTSMGLCDDDTSPGMEVMRIDNCAADGAIVNKPTITQHNRAETKVIKHKNAPSAKTENRTAEEKAGPLIHSGGVLGDLPSLKSPNKAPTDENILRQHTAGSMLTPQGMKKAGKSRGAASRNQLPKDVPPEFVCELCHKIMSDPVKTVYGNTFEATVINRWFREQGHICPLTGAPLAESDLKADDALRGQIQQWLLQKSQCIPTIKPTSEMQESLEIDPAHSKKKDDGTTEEDLYDF